VFACEGISVPVDVIAEKAGVGVGTLYRHFPTKEKLFEAILFERLAALTSEACSRLSSGDPGAAFFGFLEHVVAESSLKRDLIMALTGAGVELDSGDFKKDLEAAVGDLLRAAQEAGAVRLDVTPEVVLSLVGATCMANGTGHQKADPLEMLAIVCDGLRAPS
jgi:AcrR family transcriptional regulator